MPEDPESVQYVVRSLDRTMINSNPMKRDIVVRRKDVEYYRFYDTPENEDLLKKLIYLNRLGFFGGVTWSIMDIMANQEPKSWLGRAGRVMSGTAPCLAFPTIFTISLYGLTNYREKNDAKNYFFSGALAGGTVIGYVSKSITHGCNAAWMCGVLCGAIKLTLLMGGTLDHDVKNRVQGSFESWKTWDFALTKFIPGNYLIEEPAKIEAEAKGQANC